MSRQHCTIGNRVSLALLWFVQRTSPRTGYMTTRVYTGQGFVLASEVITIDHQRTSAPSTPVTTTTTPWSGQALSIHLVVPLTLCAAVVLPVMVMTYVAKLQMLAMFRSRRPFSASSSSPPRSTWSGPFLPTTRNADNHRREPDNLLLTASMV
jgi:hypothetical protein